MTRKIMSGIMKKPGRQEIYAPKDVSIPARTYERFEREWQAMAIEYVNGQKK
jgi:hypothetical protein